jgi:hypothetical protein
METIRNLNKNRYIACAIALLLPVAANAQSPDFSGPESFALGWLKLFEWLAWVAIAGCFVWGFVHITSRDKTKPVFFILSACVAAIFYPLLLSFINNKLGIALIS